MHSLGSNAHGQLGIGHRDDVDTPTIVTLPNALTGTTFTVHCGGNHTLILTTTGLLFGCGSDEYHQLAYNNETDDVLSFTQLHANKNWKLITCGWEFTVLVTSADEVYVCGRCDKGSLGLGPDMLSVSELTKLDLDLGNQSISRITSGIAHVVILLSDGTLIGWGSGRKGALGRAIDTTIFLPQPIQSPKTADVLPLEMVAGKDWSAIQTCNGIFIGGAANLAPEGELSDLDITEAMVSMCPNWSTLHMLRHNGTITSFGRNDHGQFPPRDLPQVKLVSAGSEHCLAIGLDGRVYAWGWNEHGNCGPGGADVGEVRALEVDNGVRPITGVAAGCATSFIW